MRLRTTLTMCAALVAMGWGALAAQEPAPAGRGGRGRGGPPQYYWVQKTKGGVFAPPNKPLTRLADLKKKHAGRANWKEMVMVGHISGRFESGEVVGSEGDILYAPPFMWHQMGNRGPGPSCRLTFGAYDPVNFNYVVAE